MPAVPPDAPRPSSDSPPRSCNPSRECSTYRWSYNPPYRLPPDAPCRLPLFVLPPAVGVSGSSCSSCSNPAAPGNLDRSSTLRGGSSWRPDPRMETTSTPVANRSSRAIYPACGSAACYMRSNADAIARSMRDCSCSAFVGSIGANSPSTSSSAAARSSPLPG